MKIDFTTKEFLTLLKSLYLADWVANAHARSREEEHREITRLRSKVYSHAKEAGFGELVRKDPVHADFIESNELADDVDAEFLARHIDGVFWRELIGRLTDKVMDEQFGAEMGGWTNATYKKHRTKIEKKVEAELRTNGLSNLILLGDFR